MAATEVDLAHARHHLNKLLGARQYPKTICPSEAARALTAKELKESNAAEWRDLMPALRELAFQLRDEGQLEILQKGQVLGPEQSLSSTSGPIRLRYNKS